MSRIPLSLIPIAFAVISLAGDGRRADRRMETFDPASVNDPAAAGPVGPGTRGPGAIRAQILLDRAGFSPGEIDGAYGRNLRVAVLAFQNARSLPSTGTVDDAAWQALNADTAPALVEYVVNDEDVAGPFEPVPEDMLEKARLPALGYSSILEALGEKFHVSPRLLEFMNPGKSLDRAGETVWVPNVLTMPPAGKAARIVVDKSDSAVQAYDEAGTLMAHYPATMGSHRDPLPIGKWKVNGVQKKPVFHYNPKLFWDAEPHHAKAKIAAGPNNPVGVVWVDLSKDHYGVHGSPEPAKVGHTQSHGCIRLTNWDAMELAEMVQPGTPAVLQE
jgi:lipoprotein-anchoring transpeptidase ErfK/SrfK